ncbi:glycosyltransferase [Candidatus Saccharibacteria bacterium]|nr:glycosyltransferase [Candidatus Saccharibacteria bacterium]MBR3377771.1 glycosyltransferase [Candidatus Saccharibacteria bacterium]
MSRVVLSVIVPAYNAEKSIRKCISSICDDNHTGEVEIIVINDGSKDLTANIVETMAQKDSRIRLINTGNKGVSGARNRGIKESRGKYVTFIDSDDYFAEGAIRKVLSCIKQGDNLDYIKYNYYRVAVDGTRSKMTFPAEIKKGKTIGENDFKPMAAKTIAKSYLLNTVWGEVIKRDRIKNAFNENIIYGEDLLFNISVFENIKKALFLDEHIYCYATNDEGVSRDICPTVSKTKIDNINEVYKIVIPFVKANCEKRYSTLILARFLVELSNNIIKLFIYGKNEERLNMENSSFPILEEESYDWKAIVEAIRSRIDKHNASLVLKKRYRKLFFISKIIYGPIYRRKRLQ